MIKTELLDVINLSNPWLQHPAEPIFTTPHYIKRNQIEQLMNSRWDPMITILTGPRQSGKTTVGRYLCQMLLLEGRYPAVLYLNCDEYLTREWLTGSHILLELQRLLNTKPFILFVDEVQRLESPGLLLKSMIDLKLPIKIIASGSSQLEIQSKVQEYLTGRHFESVILPLSYTELGNTFDLNTNVIYGCYPKIVIDVDKKLFLSSLYKNYINKDIIEILKIKNSDTIRQLLTLIAHGSGQLINYQQLATDCHVSTHTIQHYLSILKNTFVLDEVKPFVGNKRTEITKNPIYYFLDNGFRNQALNNFLPLESRTDLGLLIQSAVFQEITKFRTQSYIDFDIRYWRTKGGAEVDFVLSRGTELLVPIEVKYRNLTSSKISRGFRSFVQSYQPKESIIITKNDCGEEIINNTKIHFIPFSNLKNCFDILKYCFG